MNQFAAPQQRGASLVAKVLDAALSEIALVGPDKLSIEDVSRRAGVNKTTIYRRWPDPESLALAAFEHGSGTGSVPNLGALRADLIEYLRQFREVCQSPAMLSLARMQFTGELSGRVGAMVKAKLEDENCNPLTMFERALERGELRPGTDLGLLRDLILGGAQYRMLFRHVSCSDGTLEQMVDVILSGAADERNALLANV
jgi:AcrR family transcriptional regulator